MDSPSDVTGSGLGERQPSGGAAATHVAAVGGGDRCSGGGRRHSVSFVPFKWCTVSLDDFFKHNLNEIVT